MAKNPAPALTMPPVTQTIVRNDALHMIGERVQEIAKLMRDEKFIMAFESLRELHNFVEFQKRELEKAANRSNG